METYRPSGRFAAVTVAWVAGILAAVAAVAWLYQRLVDWIPFIYLNFLLTLGFGVVLAFLVAMLVERAKIRSPGMARGLGVLVAVVAWAASFWWAYQIFLPDAYDEVKAYAAQQGQEPISYEHFREVFTLDDFREARVEAGWTLGRPTGSGGSGLPLTGLFVYAIWLIEAGLFVAGGFRGGAAAQNRPFCETCDRWTDPQGLGPWADVDTDALRRAVRDEHRAPLLAPGRAANPTGETGTYVLHTCPSCKDGGFVDVAVSRLVLKKKDKPEVKTEVLLRGLCVSSAERDALVAFDLPPAAGAAGPSA